MATRARAARDEIEDDADAEWRTPVGVTQLPTTRAEEGDEDADMLERLRGMLSQSGTMGAVQRVSLYRVDPKSPSLIWCANYSPSEFAEGDLSMIRDQWGPGLYEARVIGAKGIATKGRFQIAMPVVSAGAIPNPGNDALAVALQRMAETQTLILQQLTQRPDPQAELMRNLEMVRSMRDAFAPAPAPAPAPAVDPVAQITSLLGAVRALKDASGEFQPEKTEDPMSTMMGMAGSIIDLVKGNSAQSQALPPMHVPPSLEAPPHRARIAHAEQLQAVEASASGDAAPISSPVTETIEDEKVEVMVFRGTLQGLLDLADKKAPAVQGGEYIAAKLPDEFMSYLDLPNWFEILSKVCATFRVAIKPEHREWLALARIEALRMLDEDDTAGD